MFATILMIVVYSCSAGTSFDGFDPHRVDADRTFVIAHPEQCRDEAPTPIQSDVTLEECQSQAMLHFLPDWQRINPERVWLGARCEIRENIMGRIEQKAARD